MLLQLRLRIQPACLPSQFIHLHLFQSSSRVLNTDSEFSFSFIVILSVVLRPEVTFAANEALTIQLLTNTLLAVTTWALSPRCFPYLHTLTAPLEINLTVCDRSGVVPSLQPEFNLSAPESVSAVRPPRSVTSMQVGIRQVCSWMSSSSRREPDTLSVRLCQR